MKRREFLGLLGGAALGPGAAKAIRWSAFSIALRRPVGTGASDTFRQGLNDGGFVEGRNVAFAHRWAEGGSIDFLRSPPILYRSGSM